MKTQFPASTAIGDVEHRGWLLQVSWFRSSLGADEGWVCYAIAPGSFHKLNIGRWQSSELALEHGRAYVDRKVDDAPGPTVARLAVQKRRQ